MDGLLNLWDRFRYTPFEYPPRAHPLPNLIVIGIVRRICREHLLLVALGRQAPQLARVMDARRNVVRVCYLVLLVLLPFYYRYGNLPSSFQNGEVGILIAEVPDEPNLGAPTRVRTSHPGPIPEERTPQRHRQGSYAYPTVTG